MKSLLILLTLTLASTTLLARETYLEWLQEPDHPLKGECVERDLETKGQRYSVKVKKDLCRPENVDYLWAPDYRGGTCFEVDQKTQGKQYVDTTNDTHCIPDQHHYEWRDGKCYIVGENFLTKSKKEKCKKQNTIYAWLPNQRDPYRGHCLEVDQKTMGQAYQNRVNSKHCRPEKPKYVWHQNSCYEIDPQHGAKAYSKKTSKKMCLEKQDTFIWITLKENPPRGKCMQVTKLLSGKEHLIKTRSDNCRPEQDQREYIWFSTERFKGHCYEVDQKTRGKEYAKKTRDAHCKPEKTNYLLHEDNCYQVDTESKGRAFSDKVSDQNCSNNSEATALWLSKPEKDFWEGKCILGGKTLRDSKCRPEQTRFQWRSTAPYRGQCYEVDRIEGRKAYANRVQSQKCRPEKKNLTFRFYRTKGEEVGHCYETDKNNPGLAYSKKVDPEKCKEKL